jgi:phospholipid N-methyltransferase
MDDWTKGYVADVDYSHGYYRELTPPYLAFSLLARGIRPPRPDRPLRYCELGAGHGFTANVIAATHPEAEVWATDFNPTFAANARRLGEAAAIPNLKVFDRSFEEFAALDLPAFDVITLHGVYSWVMAEHRKAIVDFLRDRLAIGGVVYLSYNCLPGWAPILPLRRLLNEFVQRGSGSTEDRIGTALDEVDQIATLGAGYFEANDGARAHLAGMRTLSRDYAAHEYFNRIWTPLYHVDVARQMHQAKLTFAASADLAHHLEHFCLTEQQRAKIAEIDDAPLRETLRDFFLNQQFRRDIFVRGPEALPASERRDLLRATRFALAVPRGMVEKGEAYPQGIYPLDQGPAYDILNALAAGPRTLDELPGAAEDGAMFERNVEALLVLVGSGRIEPALPVAAEDARRAQAARLNAVVLERARHADQLQALASGLAGGAIRVDRLGRLLLLAESLGHADPVPFVHEILAADARAKGAREPQIAAIYALAQFFAMTTRPLLAQHGII